MDKKLRVSRYVVTLCALMLAGIIGLLTPRYSGAEPFAYLTHTQSNIVSVVRTTDNTVMAEITVGQSPVGVALTPDGVFAYVTHYDGISVIRTADHTVVATVAIDQGDCKGIAFTPDGSLAYVANAGLDSVSVIRTADHTVIDAVAVDSQPWGVALTPNGAFVYVTNWGSNNVSVIRTLDQATVAVMAVGNRPWGVAISPTGERAYVTESGASQVSVISVSKNALVDQMAVGSEPHGLALFPLLSLPRVALSLGQNVLNIEDPVQLELRLTTPDHTPPGGAYRFEIKLWLETPMPFPKDLISVVNLAGPQDSISLPAGFDQTVSRPNGWFLPPDFLPGIYAVGASLADTVTGQEISVDIQPFELIGP